MVLVELPIIVLAMFLLIPLALFFMQGVGVIAYLAGLVSHAA